MSGILKGKGGVNASLMSFGGTGSHKDVVVRLSEISTRGRYQMVFYSGRLWVKNALTSSGIIQYYNVMIAFKLI